MESNKKVNKKEIKTEINKLKLGNYDIVCEAGTNGELAYVRFCPECHECTKIEITGKDNVMLMIRALEINAEVLKRMFYDEKYRESKTDVTINGLI